MAWDDVPQGQTKHKAPEAEVALSIAPMLGHRKMILRIDTSTASELGWSVGVRLAVAIGRGTDAGKLRLAPSLAGPVLHWVGRSERYLLARMNPPTQILAAVAPVTAVVWTRAEHALVVELPSEWMQPVSPAPTVPDLEQLPISVGQEDEPDELEPLVPDPPRAVPSYPFQVPEGVLVSDIEECVTELVLHPKRGAKWAAMEYGWQGDFAVRVAQYARGEVVS